MDPSSLFKALIQQREVVELIENLAQPFEDAIQFMHDTRDSLYQKVGALAGFLTALKWVIELDNFRKTEFHL